MSVFIDKPEYDVQNNVNAYPASRKNPYGRTTKEI